MAEKQIYTRGKRTEGELIWLSTGRKEGGRKGKKGGVSKRKGGSLFRRRQQKGC